MREESEMSEPHKITAGIKGPYNEYSSAQEWAMKLKMHPERNKDITISKTPTGWVVYWTNHETR